MRPVLGLEFFFVAHDLDAQNAPTGHGDRAHHRLAPSGPSHLAIQDDQFVEVRRTQQIVLPANQQGFQHVIGYGFERAKEGALAGHLPPPGLGIAPATQVAPLALIQTFGKPGNIPLRPGYARQLGQTHDAQHRWPAMAAPSGATRLGHRRQSVE